jgi:hypothetical protein
MKTETRYVSDDGVSWETEDEALQRDEELRLGKDLEAFLAEHEGWRVRGQETRFRAAVRAWESWQRRHGLPEEAQAQEPEEGQA